MAVLYKAAKSPDNPGGAGGTISTIAKAGARTVIDNMGKAKAFRSPVIGGTYANLSADNQASTLNNLDKEDS